MHVRPNNSDGASARANSFDGWLKIETVGE
jgi:hypothetical protein